MKMALFGPEQWKRKRNLYVFLQHGGSLAELKKFKYRQTHQVCLSFFPPLPLSFRYYL